MTHYNLGFYGAHNAALAISSNGIVLETVEFERLLDHKNAWSQGIPFNAYILETVQNYFKQKYSVDHYDTLIFNAITDESHNYMNANSAIPQIYRDIFPASKYKHCKHHEAHAQCGLYQSPYKEALVLSFDGGSDHGCFFVYHSDEFGNHTELHMSAINYGILYAIAAHYLKDIKREEDYFNGMLIHPGKIMGLAGYGEVIPFLKETFIKFYLMTENHSLEDYHNSFKKIFNLTDESRLEGELAYNIAATNQHVFEELVYDEIKLSLEKYPSLPLIIVGGGALNVINNTKLSKIREVFIPPNPSDCGQAIGLACAETKNIRNGDCTYIGPEAWDKLELPKIIFNRGGILYNKESLVNRLLNGDIYGIVRGGSETGPRALGHRSIICDPTIPGMKDILNARVKGREYYRPFAPVVRLEDVNTYFEWDKESRWMTFCPNVRNEYKAILKEITHVDGTARVQTVTRDQNDFLYDLLTEMHNQKGIGVLLNTSFNIAGKPILNTYKDALWMLDNKDMNGLILEDYIIEKR